MRRLVVVSHVHVARDGEAWLAKNRIADVIERLAELGWEVTLIARERSADAFLTQRLPDHIDVVPLCPPNQKLGGWLRARRALRDADAVLAFMPSLLGAMAGAIYGRRVLLYAGSAWSRMPEMPRWRHRAEEFSARRAAGLIGAGDAIVRRFSPHAREAALCVPLVAEEVARRLRDATARPNVESDLPWRPRLLFVGGLEPGKGAAELAAALERLPEFACRVVGSTGSPPFGPELERRLSTLPNVVVSGYQDWDGLREAYQWADVLVLPSYSEGFPRVVYEATAFGLACVVTPVGGIPARLRHGQSALFVEVGDVDSLVRALERVAGDFTLRTTLPLQAREALAPAFADLDPALQFDRALRRIAGGREQFSKVLAAEAV
ncbi:MAG TPA: hypothetical protein DEV93_13660 [Chloroflexi bacterium]|jgi:glycosyltransferase involved in cell wall biosynthesis|nr:hypothetical protein [Chloroflexota bacterium]